MDVFFALEVYMKITVCLSSQRAWDAQTWDSDPEQQKEKFSDGD